MKRLEQEEEQEKKKKVKKDIETIQTSISLSEELLKSGQQELEEVTKMTNINQLRLMAANAKISSGLTRKGELEKITLKMFSVMRFNEIKKVNYFIYSPSVALKNICK